MASISKDKNGNRAIQFIAADRKRRTIRLGKISQRDAGTIREKIQAILAAKFSGESHDRTTAEWIGRIDQRLRDKLAHVGLLPKRKTSEETTLGPFTDRYIESRKSIKPNTVYMLRFTQRVLVEYFGADKPLADVTEGDAEMFRESLATTKVSENTIRTHCNRARQFFLAAVKHRLIDKNPFGDMKNLNQLTVRDRAQFVDRETIDKVLEHIVDPEVALIVVLSRYGGLRVPSEPLAMRWGDIDWERDRITVRSIKTERHEGKATRVIPMFPEIRPHLEAAWDAAHEGQEFVITNHRLPAKSLTRRLHAAIKAAGLEPWPKPYHNMRGTRETELAGEFPIHVVCEWIGNDIKVAAKNYLQTTREHFAKALQKPVQQPAAAACNTVQE